MSAVAWRAAWGLLALGGAAGHRARPESALLEAAEAEGLHPRRLLVAPLVASAVSGFAPHPRAFRPGSAADRGLAASTPEAGDQDELSPPAPEGEPNSILAGPFIPTSPMTNEAAKALETVKAQVQAEPTAEAKAETAKAEAEVQADVEAKRAAEAVPEAPKRRQLPSLRPDQPEFASRGARSFQSRQEPHATSPPARMVAATPPLRPDQDTFRSAPTARKPAKAGSTAEEAGGAPPPKASVAPNPQTAKEVAPPAQKVASLRPDQDAFANRREVRSAPAALKGGAVAQKVASMGSLRPDQDAFEDKTFRSAPTARKPAKAGSIAAKEAEDVPPPQAKASDAPVPKKLKDEAPPAQKVAATASWRPDQDAFANKREVGYTPAALQAGRVGVPDPQTVKGAAPPTQKVAGMGPLRADQEAFRSAPTARKAATAGSKAEVFEAPVPKKLKDEAPPAQKVAATASPRPDQETPRSAPTQPKASEAPLPKKVRDEAPPAKKVAAMGPLRADQDTFRSAPTARKPAKSVIVSQKEGEGMLPPKAKTQASVAPDPQGVASPAGKVSATASFANRREVSSAPTPKKVGTASGTVAKEAADAPPSKESTESVATSELEAIAEDAAQMEEEVLATEALPDDVDPLFFINLGDEEPSEPEPAEDEDLTDTNKWVELAEKALHGTVGEAGPLDSEEGDEPDAQTETPRPAGADQAVMTEFQREGESAGAATPSAVPQAAEQELKLPAAWLKKIEADSLRRLDGEDISGVRRIGYAKLAADPKVELMFTAWRPEAQGGVAARHLRMSTLLSETGFAPRIYDHVELDSAMLVASESVGERTIASLIEDSTKSDALVMPLEKSLPLIIDLLHSLVSLEFLGVAHGDLVESALYVVDGGSHVMTFDLGTACLPNGRGEAPCPRREDNLHASPLRQAPEMKDGRPTHIANNVWQGGLVCAAMLLGDVMPADAPTLDVGSAAGRKEARRYMREDFSIDLAPGFAELPLDVAALISGMLVRDPEARLRAQEALQLARAAAEARGIEVQEHAHLSQVAW